jgi:TRAP-type C4-dicarboxylate transport system substrate-binding protein
MRNTKPLKGRLAVALPLLLVAMFVIVSAQTTFAASTPKVIEWRMQSIYPDSDSTKPCIADVIVNRLNKKLAGRLHITFYSAGQIVPEETMFSALGKGVFEAALTAPTWSLGVLYDGLVAFGLPMAWEGDKEAMDFFYKFGFIDYARKLFKEHNVYYASPAPAGAVLLVGNFAFVKPEDIKGKKIWCIGPIASLMKKLGAIPVTFPVAEVYTAMKLGTVDGCVTGVGEIEGFGLKEISKYYTLPPIMDPIMCCWLINLDAWNALPVDIQETIEDTLRNELQPQMMKCLSDIAVETYASAKKAGMQEEKMGPEALKAVKTASYAVWEEVQKKCKYPETVKMLQDYLATKGK